jgi:hypothetical protein
VSVTILQGVYVPGDPFAGFRDLAPDDRVGHSIMIYDTQRAAGRQAWEAAVAAGATSTEWVSLVRPAEGQFRIQPSRPWFGLQD